MQHTCSPPGRLPDHTGSPSTKLPSLTDRTEEPGAGEPLLSLTRGWSAADIVLMDELRTTGAPSRQNLWHVAAAGVGVAIGVFARELAAGLAVMLVPGTSAPGCPTDAVLDCLFADLGLAFAGFIKVGLLALAISGCFLLAALACLIVGIAGAGGRRRAGENAAEEMTDWRTVGCMGLGGALLVSGGWLPAQLLIFLVG
jgi:hypothetical protein